MQQSSKSALVLYSGGKGSFMAANLAKSLGYKEVRLIFNDTMTEDPDLYRFLEESVSKLGLELIRDSVGLNVWEVFEKERYVGNTRVDVCSRVLKRDRIKNYLAVNSYDPESWDIVIGLGPFEEHRISRAKDRWAPYNLVAPLADAWIDEQEYFATLCKELDISPPRLYEMGFSHNNCGGFCVKAGLGQFRMLYEKLPEVYLFHEQQQEALMVKVPTVRPFLRKQKGGTIEYLTLKQYRERYLEVTGSLTEDMVYSMGACSCML